MQQGIVYQAMMHRFFYAGLMLFRQADRHIDINSEIIHAGGVL
jgi:hypothetical protein